MTDSTGGEMSHEELIGRLENPITEDLHGYAAVLLGETMGLAAEVIREQQAEVGRLKDERDTDHRAQALALDLVSMLQAQNDALSADNNAMAAEIERLRAGYAEAIEDIEEWAGYASEYFRTKHRLGKCIERHRAALEGR